ncbi:MAG TPA: YbaK/EbsC family protein [Candidatus Limiplasma sp.]|nr:YbaK/EbsC family protein [Candidatus Limiplasma sp.]HPS82392.1 YbaK/EbsC family protein [Candidatus Limiplasma sp.]
MSVEAVMPYLHEFGLAARVMTFENSSATVELAAQCVGCQPAQIAKTLSFKTTEGAMLIVTAGDAKIDNPKYKAQFHQKAAMLTHEEVETLIGLRVGGVCPFGAKVPVYLDESLRRFEIVYPAAGDDHSAVRLTPAELETASKAAGWIDVCKGWNEVLA